MGVPNTFKRRTPEQILEDIKRMSRGKHRIYIGAAPGVGKTYAMLSDAHAAKASGLDVVVGCLDTHGREETERMIGDLEMIPLRRAMYKGMEVGELDVDAIAAREPDLVLVDELAHTNADDSRHGKRYEDVNDILAVGINVWSTLNIQHLESLNDTVRQVTGVRVRETIPDSVLGEADEIRLIDLTPDALIERLKEGKIYPRETVVNALHNFFRKGNITALRELALRAVADDTDDRLEDYMDDHDIVGPWATHDRILVALTPSPNGSRLIRRGYRRARRMKGELTVVTVTPGGPSGLKPADADRLQSHLALARKLGAQVVELREANVPEALVRYAKEHHVTEIILGESHRSRWQEKFGGSVINEVLRLSSGIDILVLGEEPKE